jgi:uncharacterized membrane protein YfcA
MAKSRADHRGDLILLIGVTAALFTIISRPLGRMVDVAREIDQSWGLQLVPGLVILAVVFMFHQVRKRHQIHAQALASAAEARQATAGGHGTAGGLRSGAGPDLDPRGHRPGGHGAPADGR